MLRSFIYRARQILFWDQARPLELFSGFNLLSWAYLLWSQPELVDRDSYAGFQALGASLWAFLLLCIAVVQLLPVFWAVPRAHDLRFVAMALASGAWLMIASSFITSGVSTTADTNYLLLSFTCMASGVWLAWISWD